MQDQQYNLQGEEEYIKGDRVRVRVKRGRKKRLLQEDLNTQRYECFCALQYLSYPALYGHVKSKHPDFFSANLNFASCNLVDTFDPNHGYKLRKLLKEQVYFNSDQKIRAKQGIPPPQGLKLDNLSIKMPEGSQMIKAAGSERNSVQTRQNLKADPSMASSMVVSEMNANLKQQPQLSTSMQPGQHLMTATSYDNAQRYDRRYSGLIQHHYPTTGPSQTLSSQYVMDKHEEGKLYEKAMIDRLTKKVEDSVKLNRNVIRQVQTLESINQKQSKKLDHLKTIADSYREILSIINIPIIQQWFEMKIEPQSDEDLHNFGQEFFQ